ncbi:hypothetical protein F511_02615 [Dorcoceras hygrometricum]|uniref:DOG1 domain-containing protein n=1 Tax=Dorcoceras hygrometricum TaxID=472368 RepID=A0A2Z7AMI1_9LAMI|nr:hypothetical protein F511_02615 [Dorcoceras hygrometricum]
MKRAASQPILKHFREKDTEEDGKINGRDVDSTAKQLTCMTIHKKEAKKSREDFCCREKAWRQEQRSGAARLKRQLKARWTMQKLIDEQLARFQAHFMRAVGPMKLSDMSQLLMPKWSPAHELAAVSWLGDWRPSTILELLRSLIGSLSNPAGVEHALSKLINDVRIEEAVIDEEMTEIQATCVLHLPFGPLEGGGTDLARVKSEFKKIHRVVAKAQRLRLKAVELVVKKVLCQTDAAEFLVAFDGIQDVIHEVAVNASKGPVSIKELGV